MYGCCQLLQRLCCTAFVNIKHFYNFGIRFDGVCKYVYISTTAVQHLRNKNFNQNRHTSKYMFRVLLLYNTAAAGADSLRTQTAPVASPVAFNRG